MLLAIMSLNNSCARNHTFIHSFKTAWHQTVIWNFVHFRNNHCASSLTGDAQLLVLHCNTLHCGVVSWKKCTAWTLPFLSCFESFRELCGKVYMLSIQTLKYNFKYNFTRVSKCSVNIFHYVKLATLYSTTEWLWLVSKMFHTAKFTHFSEKT